MGRKITRVIGIIIMIVGIIYFFMNGSFPIPFKISALNSNQILGMSIAIIGFFVLILGLSPRIVRARYPDGSVSYS
jgi:hypothetical protein